ncbi:hypothetical protein B0H11DRAFT_1942835 [Mycena galericulata]|nr:hypothetical protein B0H11DRAFT_1942835 [Mycena galericulata]
MAAFATAGEAGVDVNVKVGVAFALLLRDMQDYDCFTLAAPPCAAALFRQGEDAVLIGLSAVVGSTPTSYAMGMGMQDLQPQFPRTQRRRRGRRPPPRTTSASASGASTAARRDARALGVGPAGVDVGVEVRVRVKAVKPAAPSHSSSGTSPERYPARARALLRLPTPWPSIERATRRSKYQLIVDGSRVGAESTYTRLIIVIGVVGRDHRCVGCQTGFYDIREHFEDWRQDQVQDT